MTARPNRATHADAPIPLTCDADERTSAALSVFVAYRADPIMEPRPTPEQVRLVAQYCEEYIWSPTFCFPAEELAELRRRVAYICTLRDLADWLWDCRRIGIEPL
jgi:hypothetical protein